METKFKTMNPMVTVILPTYNRAGFLKESIESVLSQTFTDFELIVVDDGSTDHTKEVVQEFPETRYIFCPENKGVSKARNQGIALARGRYICFLDSDDLWVENKLETQIAWMESQTDCQVCYTDEIWIRKGVRVNPLNKHRKVTGNIFSDCLSLCIISASSVLMRASLFSEVGLFDEALAVCEDYDLWLRISLRYPVHLIDQKLIVKRGGHEDQLSFRYWGMDRFRVVALLKLLREPLLGEERRTQVIEMMQTKCGILVLGFAKRGKVKEVEYYRSLVKLYSGGESLEGMPETEELNALQIPGLE
ncbi:MAG: glycosyltransferase [Nitrospinae bacterium]|jgi:glycosyltransferase involved in cell wall biosynthesis|nr:glycosyltransferase [Nitrospinota bacterium]